MHLNQVMKVCVWGWGWGCVGGVILCLGAREREQHKEEKDNITRVVKRSKREQQGSGGGGRVLKQKARDWQQCKKKAPLPNFC